MYSPITHYVHVTEGRLPAAGRSLDTLERFDRPSSTRLRLRWRRR